MLSSRCQALLVIWLCSLYDQAKCSTVAPYSSLPPDPVYPSNSGTFTWPRGASTGTFTEGSTMNISWTTDFPNVNLWLIIDKAWAAPVSLVSSYSTSWYIWDVKCGQNCSVPFLLRAVNAAGSDDDQQHGGFYSYQFWVKPADDAVKTTTVPFTIVSTKADLAPTISSTSTTSSSSSTIPASSTTTTSSTTATSSSVSENSKPTNDASITKAAASSGVASNTNTTPPGSQSPGTSPTLSIGVGVGAGVGSALLCLGGVFLWRRHTRKRKIQEVHPAPIEMYGQGWQKHCESSSMYPPSRMASPSTSTAPVEAPGWRTDPHELPAQTPRGLGFGR
ncbi:hypothetical protein AUEXF2481DRAFT_33408 [Aureobasidium subglaciale EXF-2481]|uniref:Mid2 domain-containing protein n=1 Tax=Aureobasidium subglaciale (strain EXF-2481) TaxID=1043005 RepID=A0A074Y574_AURSE|nr:uncharacterized protein AUEXF2481DRAFT_33408 [Aureobasidium subglaciale EXF-2481]KEQ91089.1 hypothetical protein AUEXF2481DRAFT_33408 [Aureobasidium subglaciale EXF-2481]